MPKKETLARISKVGNSFRVRVSGYDPAYFSPREYGGEEEAKAAAIAWRDAKWDGSHKGHKLTPAQRRRIQKSSEDYKLVAELYGISPTYVHLIRRGGKK